MPNPAFKCSRCCYSAVRAAGARYCPRCGWLEGTAADQQPIELNVAGGPIVVRDLLAAGEVCNLYRCSTQRGDGVFKIAREAGDNGHVIAQSHVLRRLHEADAVGKFTPFLPRVAQSVSYSHSGSEPARVASVLEYHDGVVGPDSLYTLERVHEVYPTGIDARDMAWMWRRLLTILGFVHQQSLVHGAVMPDHVLIEPREHKLILIGWCGAVAIGARPVVHPSRWTEWAARSELASPTTDLAGAARTMLYVLGPTVDPAIARHLDRASEAMSDAWELLNDFDRLIEALWGPRQFRPFVMPAPVCD